MRPTSRPHFILLYSAETNRSRGIFDLDGHQLKGSIALEFHSPINPTRVVFYKAISVSVCICCVPAR